LRRIVLPRVVEGVKFDVLCFSFEFSARLISLTPSLTVSSIVPSGVAIRLVVVVTGRLNARFIFFPHG
jgi:hypothetical protein